MLNTLTYSYETFRKRKAKWGLFSAKGCRNQLVFLGPCIEDLRVRFPAVGARTMVELLSQEYRLRFSR